MKGLPYEDAAEERTDISGWVCKTCGRYWGRDEHGARYCCASDMPCECGGRRTKNGWSVCDACREKHAIEQYSKRERCKWDGESMIYSEVDGRFYADMEAIEEQLAWDGVEEADAPQVMSTMRLMICEQDHPHPMDLEEWLRDYMAEDDELDCREIDEIVNKWIAENFRPAWRPGKKALALEEGLDGGLR